MEIKATFYPPPTLFFLTWAPFSHTGRDAGLETILPPSAANLITRLSSGGVSALEVPLYQLAPTVLEDYQTLTQHLPFELWLFCNLVTHSRVSP